MKQQFVDFFAKISKDDVFTQAAALALYTSFSLAPLLLLILAVLSGLQLDLQSDLQDYVGEIMGPDAVEVFKAVIIWSEQREDLSVGAKRMGLITLLFSASAIFVHLQKSLNLIFAVEETGTAPTSWLHDLVHMLRRRLTSLVVVLGFIVVAISSLILSSVLKMNLFFDLAIFSLLFSAIYKWIPDRPVDSKQALWGGLITAILFILGKTLITLYLGRTAVGSAYGAAGSFVVVLAWVYYSSLTLFFGAEIVSHLTRKV